MKLRPLQTLLLVTLWIASAFCADARAQIGALATGDRGGGWFVSPASDRGGVLFFLPADGPPGALVSAMSLAVTPAAIASLDGRFVMVFDSIVTDQAKSLRQVRELRATPGPRPPMHFFSDPVPLPPIEAPGQLEGLTLTREGPLAVIGPDGTEHARRIIELVAGTWSEATPPAGLDISRPFQLFASAGAAAIAQGRGDESATIWIRDQVTEPRRPPGWRAVEVAPIPKGARLMEAQGQVMAVARDEASGFQMFMSRADRWFLVASVLAMGDRSWVAPAGDSIVVVNSSDAEPSRFSCRVLSPSGAMTYEGPAQTVGPVGRRELEVLGLLLASLVLTIAVFVFRPFGSESEAVNIPEGYALAEPLKRILATTIDAVLAIVASSLAWGTSIRSIVDLAQAVTSDFGVWPIVTAAGLLMVGSAVGEATTGRTPGKWLVGTRTISSRGTHPSWGQALARNAVKTLCPPLAAVSLNLPGQRTPASFGTLVIAPIPNPPDSDSKGGSSGDGKGSPPDQSS